jgi:hypothetical protein
MRRLAIAVALVAAVVFSGGVASARDTSIRVKAQLTGTASFIQLSPKLMSLTIEGDGRPAGVSRDLQLGRFTFVGGFDFPTMTTGCKRITDGALILTASNDLGQVILHPKEGRSTICRSRAGGEIDINMTVDIGTDRFEGISGTAELEGKFMPGRGNTLRFQGTLEGSVKISR